MGEWTDLAPTSLELERTETMNMRNEKNNFTYFTRVAKSRNTRIISIDDFGAWLFFFMPN